MKKQITIRANQDWFHIPWREIWEYRDLLINLVKRDLTAIYKQSILGPLWFVIAPLATTIVFTVIFGNVAKISTDGLPPLLFYMSSMVLWNYFQGCLNSVSGSLISNVGLFSKVYFPRLIAPLSQILSNLARFLLNFVVFIAFYLYFLFFSSAKITPSWWILAFPLLLFHCATLGLGVGLWAFGINDKVSRSEIYSSFLRSIVDVCNPYRLSGKHCS